MYSTNVSPNTLAKLLSDAEQLAKKYAWSEAADLCITAKELAPNNNKVLDQLGWYLSRAKRYKEAIEVYTLLVKNEPKMAKWPYMLGYQYYDQQKWKDAISWFEEALSRKENYIVVLYRKGYAHTQIDENDLAIQAFQRSIAIWQGLSDEEKDHEKNNYSDSCFQLGKVFMSKGQTRNAEDCFKEAIRCDSNDAYKFYNYGKALIKNGKSRDAIEPLRIANKIEPKKDFILLYLARALMNTGEFEEAKKSLDQIPERKRRDYIWRAYGELYFSKNLPEHAITALNSALRMEKRNHNNYFLLGKVHEACKDYAAAYQAYSDAVSVRQKEYGVDFPEAKARLMALGKLSKENNIEIKLTKKPRSNALGQIKRYVEDRGYGFITPNDGGDDLFFHITDVSDPDVVRVGADVNYSIENSPKGPRAKNVDIVL